MKDIGKPCAGKSHARFDEGGQVQACPLLYQNENPYGASAGGYDGQALGHVKAGRIEQMRPQVQPIRQTG